MANVGQCEGHNKIYEIEAGKQTKFWDGERSAEKHRYQMASRDITEKITLDTYNTKERK